MKIFLAFPFQEEDKKLVNLIEQLLASQLVHIITGERLGGEQITPAVQARIKQADAVVGLLSRRERKVNGGWTTHSWVLEEISFARNLPGKKSVVALVEDGVELGGMYQTHEYIPFEREKMLAPILVLSEHVGLWKREMGRIVKVQILPETLARKLGNSEVRCRHRLCLKGKYTDWIDVTPVPEPGGTFIYVEGVQDDHLVQIQVADQHKIWQSPATSQWMQVRLSSGGVKS